MITHTQYILKSQTKIHHFMTLKCLLMCWCSWLVQSSSAQSGHQDGALDWTTIFFLSVVWRICLLEAAFRHFLSAFRNSLDMTVPIRYEGVFTISDELSSSSLSSLDISLAAPGDSSRVTIGSVSAFGISFSLIPLRYLIRLLSFYKKEKNWK